MHFSINSIPKELLPLIFQNFPQDLKNVALVNKSWRKAAQKTRLIFLERSFANTDCIIKKIFIFTSLSKLTFEIYSANSTDAKGESIERTVERMAAYQQKSSELEQLGAEINQKMAAANDALRRLVATNV